MMGMRLLSLHHYWVSYPEQVKLAGGKPIYVEGLETKQFKITPRTIRKAITEKTKALLLIHQVIQLV